MQFSTTKEDYNVAEYYDVFGHTLPKLVMVNQGFCGDIIQDTFDREQMMRLHTVSKQKRVITKFLVSGQKRIVSIPISYEAKMCVLDRKGKSGQEQALSAIVKHNSLPVFVQFPRDRTISIGNQNVSTNWIPKMELVQTFDEMYFLANFIIDGVLTSEVTPVPLYLKQLRLVEVTGIKGQPIEKWNSYFAQLGYACEKLHYDVAFGNSEVAVYDPSAIYVDTMYSYVEPTIYSPMHSLFRKPILGNPTYTISEEPEYDDDNTGQTYEEIGPSRRDTPSNVNPKLHSEIKNSIPGAQKHLRSTHAVAVAPPVAPPVAPKPATKDPTSRIPALPSRKPFSDPQPTVRKEPIQDRAYGNVATRLVRTPLDSPSPVTPTRLSPKTSPHKASEQIASLDGPEEVAKLSIDELRKYLDALNLGQYADTFKTQLIDGALLVELDKDIFKQEFGLKPVEAIRLEKFAFSGHMPR